MERLLATELDHSTQYQSRQAVLTNEHLLFAPLESTSEILDLIPCHEISEVRALDIVGDYRSFRPHGHEDWCRQPINGLVQSLPLFHFAVFTVDGGFNAGTTYFMRTNSEHDRFEWISSIQRAAKQVWGVCISVCVSPIRIRLRQRAVARAGNRGQEQAIARGAGLAGKG